GHRDGTDAQAWVDRIVARTGVKAGDELLDMACGRGRHAAGFAALGIRTTGIDLSAPSIAEARERAPEATFHVHDIREPFAHARFDVVVCLFTSLGYSPDRLDDQRAVNAAAEALKPGGHFVLDLLNGDLTCSNLVSEERYAVEGVQFHVQRHLEDGDIVKRIDVQDDGRSATYTERVHSWHVDEVTALVREAGLELEAITDGPEDVPFDRDASGRIVAWARRPGGQARRPS
ncbi:MAG TPA: class I SAM-dependent methyltransferase, partial [Flavobacteriales bacterium]|nr:class I SAM-dependent methyltransferase [Flavobacteriales bacterium]